MFIIISSFDDSIVSNFISIFSINLNYIQTCLMFIVYIDLNELLGVSKFNK